MKDIIVQEVNLEVGICEFLYNRIAFDLVLKVDHLVVTNQVCILVRGLDEGVSVFQEVGQGLLAVVVLQLHHTKVRWDKSIAVALLTERFGN